MEFDVKKEARKFAKQNEKKKRPGAPKPSKTVPHIVAQTHAQANKSKQKPELILNLNSS